MYVPHRQFFQSTIMVHPLVIPDQPSRHMPLECSGYASIEDCIRDVQSVWMIRWKIRIRSVGKGYVF
jgi:hypothetical protein